jgi:hypothetical protein
MPETTGLHTLHTLESTIIPRRQMGLGRHLLIQNPGAQSKNILHCLAILCQTPEQNQIMIQLYLLL